MLFFTRIFNFKRALLARLRDKRRYTRYAVSPGFPLKAVIHLKGHDGHTRKGTPGINLGCDWKGRLNDLSANGMSLVLPPAAATSTGETTIVRIQLENHELAIGCSIAHLSSQQNKTTCGLRLDFDDFKIQKAYLQLVEAVKLGASFTPSGGASSSAGFIRRKWKSINRTRLTEWREAGSGKLDRFEMLLAEHCLTGRPASPQLEVRSLAKPAKNVPPLVETDVRKLFSLVVANLPAAVTRDLRNFLAQAAAAPSSASGDGGSASKSWLPPK